MTDNLISVVIPVYQVEQYIKRCVNSVISQQTNINYEIILVDDGSYDYSAIICDEYISLTSNAIVIHKANGGLSSARNAGMRLVNSKYLFFLDSDDWITKETLDSLYRIAEEKEVDFVRFCPMYAGWPNHQDGDPYQDGPYRKIQEGYYDKNRINSDILPRLIATEQMTLGPIVSACRSFYRWDFLRRNQLYFYDDIKYGEDQIFSAKVVLEANSFYYIGGPNFYHYFHNPSSITKSFRVDRWQSYKNMIVRFEEVFSDERRFDFKNQLHLQKLFCVASVLSEKGYIENIKERESFCRKICYDPVTIDACKHTSRLKCSIKLKLYFLLIKYKLYRIVARI